MSEMNRNFWVVLFVLLAYTLVLDHCQASGEGCCCEGEPPCYSSNSSKYNEVLYELQQYWAAQSIYQGKPNGCFDQRMAEAVAKFQRIHGLRVNGILDEATWRVIGGLADRPVIGGLPPGKLEILVDMDTLSLTILVNRQPFRSFPVAIGKMETPSPIGGWKIINKGYWKKGKTKWLGLSVPYGVYGIHGTHQPWSIGRRASHGCIRMLNQHLDYVYHWAKVGTPVYIVGDPFRDHRVMKRNLVGADIYYLQIRLKQLGYWQGKPSGVFNYATEMAVKKWQEAHGLKITGEIKAADYYRLRLYPTD